jgi:hypothetical protein
MTEEDDMVVDYHDQWPSYADVILKRAATVVSVRVDIDGSVCGSACGKDGREENRQQWTDVQASRQ